jgi:hypothetical protein
MEDAIGEGHYCNDHVWVTKTHYPFMPKDTNSFSADKIIYISRNPIDVFPSALCLMASTSHVLVPETPLPDFVEYWNQSVGVRSRGMASFH